MRRVLALITVACIAFLSGCGGGSLKTPVTPPNPPITGVTYAKSSLSGTWMLNFTGAQPYSDVAFHATFTSDGAGNLSAGTLATHLINVNSALDSHQVGSFTGTYAVNSDGRGSMTITPTGMDVAPFTLSFVLTSNKQAMITSLSETFVGSGVMVAQQSSGLSSVTGTYVFQATASAMGDSPLLAMSTGQMAINSDGTISGVRDLAVQTSVTLVNVTEQELITGTYTIISPGVLTAVVNFGAEVRHLSLVFTGDGTFYLLGSDPHLLLFGSGSKMKKSSFTASSLSGNTVLTTAGKEYDSNASNFVPMGLIGRLTSDGSSAITGNSQHFVGMEPASLNETFTAAYVPDTGGRFVIHVVSGPTIYLYLTDDNTGVFLGGSANTMTNGVLVPQASQSFSGSNLKGQYAITIVGMPAFAVAQMKADGAGNVTGTMDFYDGNSTHNALAYTGTYAVNGDGSGQMTVTVTGGSPTTFYLYMIDNSHFIAMTAGSAYPVGVGGILQQ